MLLAAGKRVFDQIVDMIESDLVNAGEDFESPRRFVLEKNQNRGFHWRTTSLHAGDFFDNDGRVRRESEYRLNPVAYLVQCEGRNVLLPTKRVDLVGRDRAIVRNAAHETLSDFFFVQVAADKNQAIEPFFIRSPGTPWPALEQHVDALEDELIRVFA